jgi:preprotein translocase subunit SecB
MSDEQPVFSIEKIYVKDLSIEVPNAPQIFLERETPSIEVQIQSAANQYRRGHVRSGADGHGEAPRTAKGVLPGRGGEGRHLPDPQRAGTGLEPILAVACPNILFPYARETVSDAINRGGFPPVILAPVNFEALYQQRLMEQQQNESKIQLQ